MLGLMNVCIYAGVSLRQVVAHERAAAGPNHPGRGVLKAKKGRTGRIMRVPAGALAALPFARANHLQKLFLAKGYSKAASAPFSENLYYS